MTTPSLRSVCRGLRWAIMFLAIAGPVSVVVLAATMPLGEMLRGAQLSAGAAPEVGAGQRALLALLWIVPAAFVSWGLWGLLAPLAQLQAGEWFPAGAFRALRRFAGATLVATLANIEVTPLSGLILTWGQPSRSMAFSVGFDTLQALVLAGCVWVLAAVFARGEALVVENRQFV